MPRNHQNLHGYVSLEVILSAVRLDVGHTFVDSCRIVVEPPKCELSVMYSKFSDATIIVKIQVIYSPLIAVVKLRPGAASPVLQCL